MALFHEPAFSQFTALENSEYESNYIVLQIFIKYKIIYYELYIYKEFNILQINNS